MLTQVCVSSGKRKKNLQLDLKKVNATPTVFAKAKQPAGEWVDSVTQGPFYATVMRKGRRGDMEDCSQTLYTSNCSPFLACFGLFDGHRGVTAAQFAADHLLRSIQIYNEKGVARAFLDTDRLYCEIAARTNNRSGTTALVAVINGDEVIAANAGDSRALLISETVCSQLTYDHVAADVSEQQRIESSGGYVMPVSGVLRVQGALAVTRGLGSPGYKQYIIPDPHVTSFRLCPQDRFLLLATDGLFMKLSNEEAKTILMDNSGRPVHELAGLLADSAIEKGSPDNLCITLVDLKAVAVMARARDVLIRDEDEQMAEEPTQVSILTPRHKGSKSFF